MWHDINKDTTNIKQQLTMKVQKHTVRTNSTWFLICQILVKQWMLMQNFNIKKIQPSIIWTG